jgi:hypothetical protein
MIVFDLACICGYTFEGWFQDRQDFEQQQTASFLVCPLCNSRDIRKILSPVRAHSKKCETHESAKECSEKTEAVTDNAATLESLQKFVEDNFEDVGTELAAESLKIHYGVAEPRNIRGITTEQEEKKLRDEGITLLKIPLPVKDSDVN